MNNILSVISFVGLVCLARADEPYPATGQQSTLSQVSSDVPQNSYVPSAIYQASDTASILNNPAYDSTLYTSFVPQDAVQQYVSQYGNSFAGQALEGFLIPTLKQTDLAPIVTPTFTTLLKSLLPGPKLIFAIVAKLTALVASAIGIVFFGGAITSFLCAFTPLCTITFLGKPLAVLKKETKEIVDKIGAEVTAERVKRAADLFKLAFEKYQKIQKPQ